MGKTHPHAPIRVNNTMRCKLYVPGKQNVITDYLSRFLNAKALQLAPNMVIQDFQHQQKTGEFSRAE
jgi:hypothetical protein